MAGAGPGQVVHALIPAAGKGERFGGATAKQYVTVAGKPVLAHAIDAVSHHPEVAGVSVMVGEDDQAFTRFIGGDYQGIETVPGGPSRAESVLNGLLTIRDRVRDSGSVDGARVEHWALVHDAARPCLGRTDLSRLLAQGLQHPDGALLAVPVHDTLKLAAARGLVEHTLERADVWAAQTPQLFPLERLIGAIEACLDAGITPTDESGAMEHAGARPLLVEGSPTNIKITRPDDLRMAEAWFSTRPNG